MTLDEFVNNHCEGKQYDSCFNSPCRYAGSGGCQHPLYPKRRTTPFGADAEQQMEELYWQASTIARDAINALSRFTTGFNQTLVHAVLNQLNGLDAQVSGLTPPATDAAGG
jgi:hypothetical protein